MQMQTGKRLQKRNNTCDQYDVILKCSKVCAVDLEAGHGGRFRPTLYELDNQWVFCG